MVLPVILKGIVLGFSIAAPVGPIGILCIRRTISEGRLSGFVSGLGAATADGLYGCVAAFGLTFISSFLVSQQFWLRLVGGLFLGYLGMRTLLARPTEQTTATNSQGILSAYLSTFFLTITNPMTILSFAAVFAGLGLAASNSSYGMAGNLVFGVVLGSALWWLCLSGIVSIFRQKFNTTGLIWVNRISGMIILGFGGLALISILP